MKKAYLPETGNDAVFFFLGDPDAVFLIAYGVIFVVLVTLVILMIRKKRKDDKK